MKYSVFTGEKDIRRRINTCKRVVVECPFGWATITKKEASFLVDEHLEGLQLANHPGEVAELEKLDVGGTGES